MTPTETAAKLQHFNDWRRGHHDDTAQPDPREIGEAIDAAIEMVDRLEAAESRLHEVAVVCATAEQERDELLARIEAMERQEPVAWMDRNGTLYNTVSHVRASDKPLYLAPGAQPAPSISPAALRPVIQWLRNGCDPVRAADELEMLAAAPESRP